MTADVEEQHQGGVMQALGCARASWSTWSRTAGPRAPRIPHPGARPDRLQNEFLNLTRGSGLISNIFDGYEPYKGDHRPQERRADLMDDGEIFTYALGKLDDRGACSSRLATRSTKA